MPNWTNNMIRVGNFWKYRGFVKLFNFSRSFPGLSFIFKYFPGLETVIAKIKYIPGFPGRIRAFYVLLLNSSTAQRQKFGMEKVDKDYLSCGELCSFPRKYTGYHTRSVHIGTWIKYTCIYIFTFKQILLLRYMQTLPCEGSPKELICLCKFVRATYTQPKSGCRIYQKILYAEVMLHWKE